MVVAIDGPAGAGKSTIARRIAERLGFLYVDTGAMYRAVALESVRLGIHEHQEEELARLAQDVPIELRDGAVFVHGVDSSEAIRSPAIAAAASRVAAIPGVRRAMVETQRRLAATSPVVMEGRDIGSVVFPDADVKIFLDADPGVRAGRRRQELERAGETPQADEVALEIAERDRRDRGRAESPLIRAPGAFYIDSSGLSQEQVEEIILDQIALAAQERISTQ